MGAVSDDQERRWECGLARRWSKQDAIGPANMRYDSPSKRTDIQGHGRARRSEQGKILGVRYLSVALEKENDITGGKGDETNNQRPGGLSSQLVGPEEIR